jgi:hypothetical protein
MSVAVGIPAAGLVYRIEPGAQGHPANPFVPDPAWWADRQFPIIRTGA